MPFPKHRTPTYPLAHSRRRKPRRWPLLLRVHKGSVHSAIVPAVALHSLFTVLIVYLDRNVTGNLGLPASIIPSLSIVVGLMLVFRNQTSYDRFWTGRQCLNTCGTCVRNLVRTVLVTARRPREEGRGGGGGGKKANGFRAGDDDDGSDESGDGKDDGDGVRAQEAAANRERGITAAEAADVESVVRILIATLFAIKHNLRAEYNTAPDPAPLPTSFSAPTTPFPTHPGTAHGKPSAAPPADEERPLLRTPGGPPPATAPRGRRGFGISASSTSLFGISASSASLFGLSASGTTLGASTSRFPFLPGTVSRPASPTRVRPEYAGLLPSRLVGFEDSGLALPVQLCVYAEGYVRRALARGWLSAPQAAGVEAQLGALTDAYGRMETIRTTPIPVAHLIHQKQVLALYVGVLPFATVDDFGWWAVPVVALVAFTLYGIEGIGRQLEDPFGYDKNDIRMDGIVEDARREVLVLLEEWKSGGPMFG